MGCCASVEVNDENRDLEALQKVRGRDRVIETDRHCTNVFFLVLLGLSLVTLFVGLGSMFAYADLDRLTKGYDDCGNVCGRTNKKYKQWNCTGQDMTDKKYQMTYIDTKMHIIRKSCVVNCTKPENLTTAFYHCFVLEIPNALLKAYYAQKTGDNILVKSRYPVRHFFMELNADFRLCWMEIILLLILTIVLVCVLLVSFICAAKLIICLLIWGSTVLILGFTIYLWVMWTQSDVETTPNENSFLIAAIIFTIYIFLHFCLICAVWHHIKLITQLMAETSKVLRAMPLLLSGPFLTVLCWTIACSLFICFTILGTSSGILTEHEHNILKYDFKPFMAFTMCLNAFMICWIVQFVIGCQQMVVALSVTSWYFTRDKDDFKISFVSSIGTLVRFHMGNVALGSMLISIVQFIQIILEGLTIYGYSFCPAGKRAFKILSKNSFNVLGIIVIGNPIFITMKAVMVMIPILIGFWHLETKEGVNHLWFLIVVVGAFSWLVAHCFISVLQMSIDSIFMSFCEDCEINDGSARPYYMSKELMNFVRDSDKVLQKKAVTENA